MYIHTVKKSRTLAMQVGDTQHARICVCAHTHQTDSISDKFIAKQNSEVVLTTLLLKICLQRCYAVSMCKWHSTFQRNAIISLIITTKQFKKLRHY